MTNQPEITSSQKVINEGSVFSSQTIGSRSSQQSNEILKIGPGYRLIRKIGSGNFGELWLAKNSVTLINVGIKLEKRRCKSPQLHLEYKFYQKLGKKEFFPAIYYFGQTEKYSALAMQLLGPNIEEIFTKSNRRFSTKTVLQIAIQVIKIFEYVHKCGIIYRDVKPDNFLVGLPPDCNKQLFLVDFGLSKEYLTKVSRSHIPYAENRSLTGTARYMSINTHLGIEQSRRDDLESIGHMLIYLLKGSLPWQGIKVNTPSERYKRIGNVKMSTVINVLCKDLPPPFEVYLRYCRNLGFYDTPDYSYLQNLFLTYYGDNFSTNLQLDLESGLTPNSSTTHSPKHQLIPKTSQASKINLLDEPIKKIETRPEIKYNPSSALTNQLSLNPVQNYNAPLPSIHKSHFNGNKFKMPASKTAESSDKEKKYLKFDPYYYRTYLL